MSWTDDRVTLLKKLWGEGKTAAEIAKELGGVTRNAVIGKAHRLKLSGRVSPIQQNNKKSASKPAAKPAASRKKKPRIPESKPFDRETIPMTDLGARACRWPIGDPQEKGFGFCGERAAEDMPYCSEHAQMAYQAATRNRLKKAQKSSAKTSTAAQSRKKASG